MAKTQKRERVEDYDYERLAEQIIIRAAKDYRNALKRLYKHPENPTALATKKEIERFFRSEWFQVLSDIDPNVLIEGIKVKVKREIIEAKMKEEQKQAKAEEKKEESA